MPDLSELTQQPDADQDPHPEKPEYPLPPPAAEPPSLAFHLSINVGMMIAGTAVLKLDGPYYADAIVAGMFAVSAGISLYSYRLFRGREQGSKRLPASSLFLLLTMFFLASAFAVILFTYVLPADTSTSDEGGVAWRSFSSRSEAC